MRKFLNKTILPFGVNPLGLLSVAILIISLKRPWWRIAIDSDPSYIFPWGIVGPVSEMIGYRRSPEMLLLTRILIVSACVILISSMLKGKILPRILIGFSSLICGAATFLFYRRLGKIAANYNTTQQGKAIFFYANIFGFEVETNLEPGFYLIAGAAICGLLACILHHWIRIPRRKKSLAAIAEIPKDSECADDDETRQ